MSLADLEATSTETPSSLMAVPALEPSPNTPNLSSPLITDKTALSGMRRSRKVIKINYRVITGSEDTYVNWFEGPPFKYNKGAQACFFQVLLSNLQKHSRFVSCVRFSPDGALAVSVGTDKKIVLYDGKTFDVKKELENAHSGGIYGVSWSADNKRFLTASADKSCKIW